MYSMVAMVNNAVVFTRNFLREQILNCTHHTHTHTHIGSHTMIIMCGNGCVNVIVVVITQRV